MTAFIVGALVLLALAAWLLRPAWQQPAAAAQDARGEPLRLLAEEIAALDRASAADDVARAELQRRLLVEAGATEAPLAPSRHPRRVGVALALGVPLFAIAMYAALGSRQALDAPPADASGMAQESQDVSPQAVQAMVDRLAQRLEASNAPTAADLPGWIMLARSYTVLQRYADADRAYVRAIALSPGDAQLLADRADVLAMVQGQRLAGEPERLVAQALAIDPQNLKALALAGSAAFERQDYPAAQTYWQKARAVAPGNDEFSAGLDRSLEEVRVAMGAPRAATAEPSATTAGPAAAGAARIVGRVSLAPALAARVAPGDTVFVFARAAEGPRMPLAIVRRTVAELPFTFTLDDSQAMSPQMRLSAFDRVVVGARVSRSGSATPQAGDLVGQSAVTGIRNDQLELVIDAVQAPS